MKSPTITIAAACLLAAALPAAAQNQPANQPIQFRVAPAVGNPTGCTGLDASLSRVHTITVTGDRAVLKSSGGINDTLKQTAPRVYRTTFRLGDVTLEVVADAANEPKSLTVTEPKRGCHWAAVAA